MRFLSGPTGHFKKVSFALLLSAGAIAPLPLATLLGGSASLAQQQMSHPFEGNNIVYVQSGDRWREAFITRISGQWHLGEPTWRYTVNYLDDAGGQEQDVSPERMVTIETAQSQGLTNKAYDLSTPAGIDQMLEAHNEARREVGVSELTWSPELADFAQEWANTLLREGQLRHRPAGSWSGGSFGENLSGAQSSAAGGALLHPQRVVENWVSEKAYYDYASNTCEAGTVCGHYTQVVWDQTTQVGCGVARNEEATREVWVCNYTPAGNFVGERPY